MGVPSFSYFCINNLQFTTGIKYTRNDIKFYENDFIWFLNVDSTDTLISDVACCIASTAF